MTIYEQLTEYCDCLNDVKERDVDELINLISSYTGWMQHTCETFLFSDRKEVIDIPDCICNCDVFEFEPLYAPFDKDSFVFTLVEQNGIQETTVELTNVNYSTVDEKFRMELPLPDCKCRKPKCGCESKYKLLVTYGAGYELLPECLLPLFCEALQWIAEKNKCDCDDCQPCNPSENTIQGVINYASLTGRLQEHFLTVLTVQYFRQLSLISLAKRNGYLWGVVV